MKMNLIPFVLVFNCILLFTFAEPIRECTEAKIGDCNSKNPKIPKNCPLGTKANPLEFWWNIQYQLADGKEGRPKPPDGCVRYVYTINGETPGPTIHANKGDWVSVFVTNNITKPNSTDPQYTSIHWHGISMRGVERQQKYNETEPLGTPFMDGVPGINQCPIRYNETFDYLFQCVDSGTFWYHSHQGVQLADGLVGSLIVKDCNDCKRFNYSETDDWDANIVTFQDWYHRPAEDILKKYMKIDDTTNFTITASKKAVPEETPPDGGLVGGAMFNDCSQKCENNDPTIQPQCIRRNYTVYEFVPKRRYRLRLISMAIMSMVYFSIDNHTFEINEVDGMLVQRNETTQKDPWKQIPINAGQRYSIFVNATETIKNYWMRFYFPGCSYRDNPPEFNDSEVKAIVHYQGAPDDEDPKTSPNPNNCEFSQSQCNCTDLDVSALTPLCDKKYGLFCNYQPPSVVKYNFTMDVIMDAFNQSLLVDQKDKWEQNVFGYIADKAHGIAPYADHHFSQSFNNTFLEVLKIKNNGYNGWDPLMNAYNLIDGNSIVDILFNNIDTMEHPIHLHGHFFYVLGWGQQGTNYSESLLNIKDPIQRDSATVPSFGWLKIRFAVDNPGVWPMHCHIDWHIAVGMLAQFVELPRNATNIFNKEGNKAPYEWCKACTAVPDATQYCAAAPYSKI